VSTKTRVVVEPTQRPTAIESRSATRFRCVARPTRASWVANEAHWFNGPDGEPETAPRQGTYRYTEVRCNGGTPYTISRCIAGDCAPGRIGTPTGPPPPVQPDGRVLAVAAIASLEYRAPRPILSPPQTPSAPLVGMPTFFAVTPEDLTPLATSATDCDQDLCTTVSVTATPTALTFDPGTGDLLEDCPLPGAIVRSAAQAAAADDDCAYTYQQAGSYAARISLHYTVAWSSDTGLSGTEDRTTQTALPLVIKSAQPVLVAEPTAR
jgi:hypothetical protein